MNLQRRPLFLFAVAYIAGIVSAVETYTHPFLGIAFITGILLGGCVLSARITPRAAVGVMAAVFVLGFVRTVAYRHVPAGDVSELANDRFVELAGSVASDPEPSGKRVRFVLKCASACVSGVEQPVVGRVMVTLYPDDRNGVVRRVPFYGETVRIRGRLRVPRPPSNPGAFDYREYLARKRVFCTMSTGEAAYSVIAPAPRSVAWLAAKFKAFLTSKCLALFPSLHAFLLLGILLGNYALLPVEVQTAFMRSGTMHLLAASGYNCGIIVAIFGTLMRRLTAPRIAVHWLLIALLWIFTLVAGAGPSIVRAALMVTVFLLAYVLWRAPDVMNIVLFAALMILGANPLNLYDVGFQLSFAAVFSILLVMPLVNPLVNAWLTPSPKQEGRSVQTAGRLLHWTAQTIVLAVVVSVVAALGTWPITAYCFNYLSVVSIVANAVTALMVLMLTALGIAALAIGSACLSLGKVVALPASAVAGSMLWVVVRLGDLPWAAISLRSPHPLLILLYYLTLIGVLEYAHRKVAVSQGMDSDRLPRATGRGNLVSGPAP